VSGIVGHAPQIAAFRAALGQGRVHHAWLLAGPRGIGKARFAEAAAMRFLAEGAGAVMLPGLDVPPGHPTEAYIRAGSHPDYRRLERLFRDKTGDTARSITVDQVRGLQRLFATTASLSPRRAVVIDAIDDMERAGANALLKNLEEPPADTLFLLVSHAPGRLLPTIRSRCRLLRFDPLDDADMRAVLEEVLPGVDPAPLIASADGAPGTAIRHADLDIAGLDAAMARIAASGDADNRLRLTLAQSLATKAAQPRYEAFLERMPAFLAMHARRTEGRDLVGGIALWEEAGALARSAVPLSLDPQMTVFQLCGLIARLAVVEKAAA
jgi:DNA polymerase-3 subunit delta'